MTIGYGIGTPAPAGTQVNTLPLLTLDAFARIMRFFPVASFMGVVYEHACEVVDCNKRNAYAQAARASQQMMQQWLVQRGYSLFDQATQEESRAPYFALKDDALPVTTTLRRVSALVAPPISGAPEDLATITASSTLAAGETLAGISVSLPTQKCDRLGVELMGLPLLENGALTLYTRAYNLIDLDSVPDAGVPQDNVPYLTDIYLDLLIQTNSIPVAHWPPDICATPCAETTSAGCLYPTTHGIYEVRDFQPACYCQGMPDRFTLGTTHPGVWSDALADATVSLLNTRIPINYCVCDPVANVRYQSDVGDTEMYRKTYPYAYSNPFGILMPGAQYAWKQLQLLVSGTQVARF